MPVKVEVQVDEQAMGDFMVYHIYTSIAGIIAIILGVLNIGLTVAFIRKQNFLYAAMFAAFAILILLVFPYVIRRQVAAKYRGAANAAEQVTYEFTEEGIMVDRKEVHGLIPWSEFAKAVKRKRILILYRKNKKGVVFPIQQMGEQYDPAVDMIYAHMPAPKVRIPRPANKQEQKKAE